MSTDMPAERVASGCNCFAIRSAARQATQFYDRHLAPSGLRTTQFSLLATLARLGPLAINELAARMAMDRTTMGRALRPLEREGLVRIGPGRDGRTRALDVTDTGRERVTAAQPLWRAAQDAFEGRYGKEEAAALRAALARVHELA
ncbi:MarR family winged helix-turn-helix transcriptional regulator [uncultured Enterovirga sp.]|uniref:MarR family winged helix-turn-helix transcriptional regulator n=1 Tax=uncultured Enterovirga sp. TaxID=2026352 RepID=UPI0035CB753C